MVWRHIAQNKWKRCHTTIEYRTKNYAKQSDNSTATLLDDAMNITLIDNASVWCGTEDDVDNNDERTEQPTVHADKVREKPDRDARSLKKGGAVKRDEEQATMSRKTIKISSRSAKRIDQYSEKRCLTADEEQFDFSLQDEYL